MTPTLIAKVIVNDDLYMQHASIRQLLEYTNKFPDLTAGINCSHQIDQAEQEFNFILNYYQKEPARYIRHYIISSDVIKDPREMLQIGYNIARFFANTNQVFIAVHTDKESHIHAHLIVNTVSCYTGTIFSYNYDNHRAFLTLANSFGYHVRMATQAI